MQPLARALVTGGAGFLGSHVAEELLRTNAQVVIVDDLSGGYEENIPEGAMFVKGNVEDEAFLGEIFARHHFTHVYHLAAYAAEGLSHFIRRYNYSNNLLGSASLVNLCVRYQVQCLVFTSSIAVYGKGQVPFTEADTPRPEDPYGVAKLAVELDLRCAHEMFGLNYVVFRPHNVYGERQNLWDMYRNVVGIFIHKAMHGDPLPIFGDGTQSRAFSYVADVAIPIAHAGLMPEAYNQVFNIGANEPVPINALVEELSRVVGKKLSVIHLPERHEVQHAFSSHEKAWTAFGHLIHTTPLAEGLRRTVRWAWTAKPRDVRRFANIEICQGLPPSWN